MLTQSLDGQIFRLMKLPLELRYRIYEFAVISERLLRVANANDNSNIIGLALLRTSRQLSRECTPFFWNNNFKINEVVKNFIPHRDQIAKNVREITFEWWGFAKKDIATQLLRPMQAAEGPTYQNYSVGCGQQTISSSPIQVSGRG
jgi:hypothetical protein